MSNLKNTVPRFDGKPNSDFQLWYARIRALLQSKGLLKVIEEIPEEGEETDKEATPTTSDEDKATVSSLIIQAIGDKPLRVVINHVGNPAEMILKLRERYASTNMTSRMVSIFQLMNLKFTGGDMGEYVDTYSTSLDRLESMKGKIPDELAVAMFLYSMNGKFESTVAALRQMEVLSWDDVSTRLIEESRRTKVRMTGETAYVSQQAAKTHRPAKKQTAPCEICHKSHQTKFCRRNPDNLNNRINKERTRGIKYDARWSCLRN